MADGAKRAFVAGHPIAHSRSPLIHIHWLEEYGIAGSYERIDVAPADFPGFLEGLARSGYAGGNVTIPHKEAAARLSARLDPDAEIIGAANTLWLEEGTLHAGNTDAYGFCANLDAGAAGWRDAATAVVLGAGGAARAVLLALRQAGIGEIRLVNRTFSRAQALADRFGSAVRPLPWAGLEEALSGARLLVNTTSLGMEGQDALRLDLSPLASRAVVTDIVYAPLETPLLALARQGGFKTVDGLGMLLHQAVPGFERWFGVRPRVTGKLRALVVADLEARA